MFYYAYQITNIVENKKYIGSRGSYKKPEDDLGKIYFSSSKDSFFINDQKNNPHNYKYEIIKTFATRQEAYDFEIKEHLKNNIPENKNFYNKSRQKTSGFSTEGVLFINGVKIKCEDYKKQNILKHHCYKKVTVKDSNGNTFQVDINDERYKNGEFRHLCVGMVTAFDKNGNRKFITTDEYYNGDFICNNTGKIPVKDKKGRCFLIEKNSELIEKNNLCHVSTGLVSVVDTRTNETKKVTQEEFLKNNFLIGVNKNKISKDKNPNAKTIKIFNEKNELVVECKGNFKETCIKNKFPFAALRDSTYDNGKPIFTSKRHLTYATKNNLLRFVGWYAIIEDN
jgi:hypothetical protein